MKADNVPQEVPPHPTVIKHLSTFCPEGEIQEIWRLRKQGIRHGQKILVQRVLARRVSAVPRGLAMLLKEASLSGWTLKA